MFHTCHIYNMSTIHLLLNFTFMSEACSTQGKFYQCQLFISFVTFALKTDFHTCNILLFLVAAPCSKMAPASPNFCTICKFQSSGGSLFWAEWMQKLVQNVHLQWMISRKRGRQYTALWVESGNIENLKCFKVNDHFAPILYQKSSFLF